MQVLALIEGVNQPCYRYRLEAFAWSMAERGLLLEAVPLEKPLFRRVRQLLAVRRADVVILQRKLLPRWQLALLRWAAKRLVYNVNDAVFQRDSYHPKGSQSVTRRWRFAATVKAADLILVGNEHLREKARQYVEPQRVCVVPTCLEPTWYVPAAHCRAGSQVRLAWIGQRSTLPSLHCAAEHLAAAAAASPGLRLRVIGDLEPTLPGVEIDFRPWSAATEAAELAEADIGVNWLPDDSWSLGKCGLRVLQYMAAGLPVVANPVGMNRENGDSRPDGVLGRDAAGMGRGDHRLADAPALRQRMGAAGRRLVEKHFGVAAWGPRLAAAIDALARDVQHCRCLGLDKAARSMSGDSQGGKAA